jgi:hypothetical protein
MLNEDLRKKLAKDLAQDVRALLRESRAPAAPNAGRRLILPDHARDPDALDELTRARHERRIRFISGRYALQWLVDQHLDGGTVEDAGDSALLGLLRDCEKALKAVAEGVSFDDAGLVRWAD